MSRWLQAILITLLGLAVGLFYGWRVAPVEYVNTTPDLLHQDYKNEYILMVAEAFSGHNDINIAMDQLTMLENGSPAETIQKNIADAEYSPEELALINNLLKEIEALQTPLNETTP